MVLFARLTHTQRNTQEKRNHKNDVGAMMRLIRTVTLTWGPGIGRWEVERPGRGVWIRRSWIVDDWGCEVGGNDRGLENQVDAAAGWLGGHNVRTLSDGEQKERLPFVTRGSRKWRTDGLGFGTSKFVGNQLWGMSSQKKRNLWRRRDSIT